MGFVVVEADLDAVEAEVTAALESTRRHSIHPRRYAWLYRRNPDGPAVLWTIRDECSGTLAGFTAALPRRMLVRGREVVCWNCADFSIYPRFRSLGVAIQLRKAATRGVDNGRVGFLYAHPNATMQVVHQRAGHRKIGCMIRFVKLLRSGGAVERILGGGLLTRLLSTMADGVLRISGREGRHRFRFSLRAHTHYSFDARADGLFGRCATATPLIGVRDASYLNWRYRDCPLDDTIYFTAENHGDLVGYAVIAVSDNSAVLKDILSASAAAVPDLVAAILLKCRELNLASISATVLDGTTFLGCLVDFGFSRRGEASSMFGYAPETSWLWKPMMDGRSWYVTAGDRDV